MKTPGSTAMRSPQNAVQPSTCSRRSPAMRRAMSSSSPARSNASSSAKTQPAARSRATTSGSGGAVEAAMLEFKRLAVGEHYRAQRDWFALVVQFVENEDRAFGE